MSLTSSEPFVGYMTSLLKLVKEHSIVIPVIQRDYAQGRKTERVIEIRKRFVNDLVSCVIAPDEKKLDLDFVYGDLNENVFIPLDGQQRLTTLFLFYLYVAGKSGHFDVFQKYFKNRFSYQTRKSSTTFCEKIIENNVFDEDGELPIYLFIQNQCWFFKSWMQDPTVAGMLEMLNAFEENFKSRGDSSVFQLAFERLFESDKDPIEFWLLPLNKYTRSDDLYIKMNARGVGLTDVEVFKARFEDYLEYSENVNKAIFNKKMDGEWSDFFWPRKSRWGCENGIDSIIENIIRLTIGLSYRSSLTKDMIKDVCNNLFVKMRFSFSQYCEVAKVFHFKGASLNDEREKNDNFIVQNMVDFFDFLCDNTKSPIVSNACKCDNKWFDVSAKIDKWLIDSKSMDYQERVRLYAYLRYCARHKSYIDINDLNSWMLFIRNLDESTRTDEMDLLNNALVSIDNLLDDIGDDVVIEWLARQNESYGLKHFRKNQFVEECIKSQIYLLERANSPVFNGMGALIDFCNSHDYLRGQMSFILLFSGWSDEFKKGTISSLNKEEYDALKDKAQYYVDVAKAIVDGEKCIVEECLVERALLASETELCMKIETDRLNFYNQRNHRDYSIKNLLMVGEKFDSTSVLDAMKHFFDGLDAADIVTSLKRKISSVNQRSWRYLFCKDSVLIKYCSQGFICAKPTDLSQLEPNVFLLAESQMNHHHSELYSRDLYERNKDAFAGLKYLSVKSRSDYPGLYFDFKKTDYHYRCIIIHKDGKWAANIYEINQNQVPLDVQSLLSVVNAQMNGDAVLSSLYANVSGNPDCSIIK